MLALAIAVAAVAAVLIAHRDTIEPFLLDLAWSASYIPISMQMVAANSKPEHWEGSSVKGLDLAYRNMSKLISYENAAFQEAGWKPVGDVQGESGPNTTSLAISLSLLTLVCSSFFVLVVLM